MSKKKISDTEKPEYRLRYKGFEYLYAAMRCFQKAEDIAAVSKSRRA